MKILYTYSDTPLSRMIREITGEPVSHVVIERNGVYTHSSVFGLKQESAEDFLYLNKVYAGIEVPEPQDFLARLVYLVHNYHGYDFKALFFLGLRYLFPSFTPKVNLWQVTNQYICTELVTYLLDGEVDSMITPYQHYLAFSATVKQPKESFYVL